MTQTTRLNKSLNISLRNKDITVEDYEFWIDMENSMNKDNIYRIINILKDNDLFPDKKFYLEKFFKKHLTHWREENTEGFT